MEKIALLQESEKPSYMLYEGEIQSQDIFIDIERGYEHFFQSNFNIPIKNFRDFDFSLTLAPHNYYHMPVVEFINYYLKKYKFKSMSSMSLTAVHEAISNSLLWGLLKVKRPEDRLQFGQIIEEKLAKINGDRDTLSVALTDKEQLTVHIINPHDDSFDINKFKADDPRFPRGFDLIQLFSHIVYNEEQRILSLTFRGEKSVLETIAQPQ